MQYNIEIYANSKLGLGFSFQAASLISAGALHQVTLAVNLYEGPLVIRFVIISVYPIETECRFPLMN